MKLLGLGQVLVGLDPYQVDPIRIQRFRDIFGLPLKKSSTPSVPYRGVHSGFGSVFRSNRTEPEKPNLG